MILDNLDRWLQYGAISPRFAKAFAFLRHVDDRTPVGRHEIAGDEVYAFVQRHATRRWEDSQFEAHRKYIDVQYIHHGCEVIYWAPLVSLTHVTQPFDPDSDAALYGLVPDAVPFKIRAGQFAILFPEDGHIPSCICDQPAEVFKVVVKVRV